MRRWFLGTILSVVATAPLAAQEVTGRIEGRMLDPNGSGLAEVEVTVSSPSLLGTRATTSDRTGRFQIRALPVGTYRLAARRIGFRPVVVENVPVRLGETASLPRITLPEGQVELEEITVTADAAGLDPKSTASSTRLDARQLDALPLTRNFRDIALLAPASVPSFLGRAGGIPDGINIGGATGLENSYFVDGIDITDVIQGGTSLDLPYNFVQQIEIRTGGSTAEDAQALGGVVNVVTPSGGEQWSGGLFSFYSADALRTDPRAVLGSSESGFTFYDIGATLSGPLMRRRLWLFAAYNRTSEGRDHALPFGGLRDTRRQNLFAGKMTWRAGPHTLAYFTVLGDPSHIAPLGFPLFGTGVPLNPEVLQKKGTTGGIGLSLRAQHFLTPALLIEGAVSQITRLNEDEPATQAGRTPVVVDQLTGTIYGGNGGASRFDSRRRAVNLAASWQLGSHALKVGGQYQTLFGDQTIDISRTGAGGTITRLDSTHWSWHSALGVNGRAENRIPSFFVQDAWQVDERLLVNMGLRWSRQSMHNLTSDTLSFRVRDGLQPRFGVVYQPGRLGTQRLYGSYARVANQIVVWGAEANGFGAETLFVFPRDPRVDTTGGSIVYALPRGGGVFGDGTLRGETSDEWAIGYDQQLTSHLRLSIRGVRRMHRDAVQLGLDTLGVFVYGNPGRGALAHFPLPRRTYHALELIVERTGTRSPSVRLSYVLSRTHGNYPGLYGSDWRLPFAHFGPRFFTPEQHVNGTGLLPNDRTHLLKVFGSQQVGPRLVVGASLLVASGTPLSEYGAIQLPPPFRGFVRQRGTAGRTPTIWDLGIRASYDLMSPLRSRIRTRLLLDLEHIGSPRKALDYDQVHFICLDDDGNQSCPNASYGRVTWYQPPMMARLGVEIGF
jgi:hypothetical protein